MPEMPTLGAAPRKSPVAPIAITAVVVGLLTGGIFWVRSSPSDTGPALPTPLTGQAAVPQAIEPAAAPAPTAAAGPSAAPPVVAEKSGLRAFQVTINGPLESAIVGSEGKEVGTPLTTSPAIRVVS